MADFPSPLGPTSSPPPSGPALLCVLALAGCQTVSWLPPFGPQTEPVDPNPTEVGECPPDSQVTWDTFAKGFLQTQCTQCHSALYEGDNRRGAPDGVDFDTYEGAYQWRDRIAVRAGMEGSTMPPAGGTTDEDRALLMEWVACGAPGTSTLGDACDVRVAIPGDATLTSSEDVQALCSQGNTLEGSLTVQGTDLNLPCLCAIDGTLDLSDAQGAFTASTLREVGASVVMNGSGATEVHLPDLIDIGTWDPSDTATTTADPGYSLPPITSSGGDLQVGYNPNLVALDLPALVRVGGELTVDGNSVLSDLAAPYLTTVNGGLTVLGNPLLGSLDVVRLRWVLGDLTVVDNPLLADLETTESIDTVLGSVHIVNNDSLMFLGALHNATWVGGAIDIVDNDGLVDISGFTYLYDLFQTVTIADNDLLFQVPGFQNVGTITGDIAVTDNANLERLAGFVNLYTVNGSLRVEGNPQLWDLNGFEQILEVDELFVSGSEDLGAQASFETLQVVHGDVAFVGNPGFLAFTDVAFASLHTIEGDLLIQQCPDLEGIEGFAALTDVSGNVAIGDNTALVEIVGLPLLQNVGGNLRLFRNDALDNVAGMTAVTAVTGNLEVTENAVLTSVEPLYSITGVGADLLCTDNLILPTSQCDTLVQTIGPANIGGTVTVSGNGPG